ncbi:probable LRR receptor-like serine/threonine-protein kinase At4g31250 [Ziziphus jujuba]|uniref:Probable LRR receptor-like serine/threonine-protein kinase At4g31250 n=1 Tax=Ziziphus jujuba TaxID=326968 RepID=A0ABM4A977_ZIZJJ|nr:probable LRR receptor-like serine/threonine-protein kinase At4g31250 [Ziziphus jujuba]
MASHDKPIHVHHWLLIVHVMVSAMAVSISADTDADVLLQFTKHLQSSGNAFDNWNTSNPLCSWSGVICLNGSFHGLKLENKGLTGIIDIETLTKLSVLRSFSVMNNSFRGPIPEVKKLRGLRSLFLSHNEFAGELRDDVFKGMKYLKKVHLARNGFKGKVPKSLAGLSRIMELDLSDNQFEGKIPKFRVTNDWKVMNVSYNRFEGRIPASLSNADPSAFAGNIYLCGKPLGPCKSSSNKRTIIIAVIVSVAAILAIIVIFLFLRTRKSPTSKSKLSDQTKPTKAFGTNGKEDRPSVSSDDYVKYNRGTENGTLHLVKHDREKFELDELLRASAEVLGSGSFGSSYKAVLLGGPAMVVKRFRHMNNVGKDEFQKHMERLGKLSHPNLHPLIAFYYRKEEKLLVSDFVENGSLASHLHGKRAPGQAGLDWPTRLNIIKGVARGLAYLYKEFPNQTLPHGHLKSSNILLDHNFNPIITEYGLVPVINKDHAQQFMAVYKSPEFSQYDKITSKSDVWSLGILILELLTGKFPANYLKAGKRENSDLATWVNSVVREEWTGEVFDKDMKGTKNGEGEMLKLLKIGLCCCEASVERRWVWKAAVEKIEELKERESEEDYSSYASDWDVYSSRVMTEDEFSFSIVG